MTAGSKLGKYEILKRLATGGMAEIFLARASGLPGFTKMVVIKRILPQLATKSDFIEMFLDEARIAATLQHPNVVQMYDVGVVDGNYFIAMEYLHGEDVRSLQKTLWKREEKVPLEHALNIMIGVCSGLHYAHDKVGFDGKPLNIVHRDVTPQNIIVTYEGGVKLLDFGIAKASNRFGETRFGTLKGKVPYMSPEQCRGEPLDRRSDIFSLGIMLYELTLGRKLYKGASDFEVLKQIVEGTVTPPHQIDPGYDRELEAIVMHALEKERDKRFQTARELQTELETLVRQAQLYVSPIALQQFMEKVFGRKIEAWREAQARGLGLDEHLKHVPVVEDQILDDEDLEEIDARDAEAEEAAARERAALKAAIEARSTALSLSDLRAPPPARRSRVPLMLAIGGVLVLGGVALLKLRHKKEPVVVVEKTVAPPQTPAEKKVEAKEPEKAKEPEAPPAGIAKIVTSPAGATLYLDGKKLDAVSPYTFDRIDAGREHVLLAQLDGYKDAVEKFTLAPNEVRTVEARLHHAASASHHGSHPREPASASKEPKEPKAAPVETPVKLEGEGTLVVASNPWAQISVDGSDRGQTPVSLKLPAGKHTVVLTNPEFKINRSISVMVLPNETVRKKLDFTQ
ncbi:MAG TPA: serine/threonine-protein kinase [Polyangia bacterium]|nr:serine/threonine-protein kinase [Polyangia bacterium]